MRIKLISDDKRLYELLGSKAVYFVGKRQGWKKADAHGGKIYLTVAKGTKYSSTFQIPDGAIEGKKE